MKEYIFLLLITYVIWIILAKIISNAKFKNVRIMPILLIIYVIIYCIFKSKYYLSEKPFIILGLWFIMDNEPKEKLRSIATVLVFSNIIEMTVFALQIIFNNEAKNTVKPEIFIMLIFLCILLTIYFIRQRGNNKENQKNYDLYMYIMIGVFGVAVAEIIDGFRYNTDRLYDYSVILSMSVVLNTFLSLIFLAYIIINNDVISRYYNMEKRLNEEQKLYYEILLQREEETKKFRHDITNQLINIRKLAEESADKSVIKYTSEISEKIDNIGSMVYKTGNRIIDVMLNYYIGKLDKGIQVHIKGMLDDNIYAADSDLNIIFGNIFKNIREELKNCDKGFIYIECTIGDEYSCIVIENSLDTNIKNEQQKKHKGKNFGYGINNIKKAAKRNYMKYKCEKSDEKYRSEVVFKNIKQPFEELSNPSRRNS